jgi:hypothetical protein
MEKSIEIQNLTKALIQFQAKMKPLELDAEVEVMTDKGGKYKFKYATLENIIESTRTLLANNGLALIQTVGEGGCVTTLLMHESGEWIQDTVLIAPVKSSPQAIGSSITYAKRYSMTAILRLVSESDDDGNVAEGNEVKVEKLPPKFMTRKDDPRPWLKEEEFKKAVEFLKNGKETIAVKEQGDMGAEAFVDWLFKTYKMKRMYMEEININLQKKQYGSSKPA